jgi:hypothetical protein
MSIIVTVTPPAGDPIVLDAIGVEGAIGSNGWTPVLAVANDGARRVLKVVDWAGGEGTKPATGQYVGAGSTLVTDIADAVDIRGGVGPAGPQGDPGQIITSGSIHTGDGVPDPGLGIDNDLYIDNLTADIYQKQSGSWVLQTNIKGAKGDKGDDGDPGTPGNAGADGSTILLGVGTPAGGLGAVGDQYIETTTFGLYSKTGSTQWTSVGTFKGAAGNSIRVAAGAPSDTLGVNGDSYVNASNGDLYTKSAGTYTISGNLKGPQGPAGIQGDQGIAGPTGTSTLFGTGAPSSGLGNNGDSYINTSTYHLYTKAAGSWTDTGSLKGANGTNGIGNAIFTGSGQPDASTSIDGDIWIDTATGNVYQKQSGAWSSVIMNIRGPQGQSGAAGAKGDKGDTGSAGTSILAGNGAPSNTLGNNGDNYINKTNGDFFGPKASGAWPTSTLNLKGPTGDKGDTGDPGADGTDGTNFLAAQGVPNNGTTGVNGDMYLNLNNGDVYGPKIAGSWGSPVYNIKGVKGDTGSKGDTGDTGPAGAAFLSGAGAPSSGLGANGDSYANATNGDVYTKSAGSWGSPIGSIKGATGAKGDTGDTGTRGSTWSTGAGTPTNLTGRINGDFYLNSTNGEVWQVVSGAWADAGFSIKGAQGTAGSTGAAGPSNLPMTSVSAARTIDASDKGTCLFHPSADTTARTWTINNDASSPNAWTNGDTITFINQNAAGALTIAISGTSAVLRLVGSSSTGSRTLAANGMATAVRGVDGLTWYINGTGLT